LIEPNSSVGSEHPALKGGRVGGSPGSFRGSTPTY